MVDIYEKRIDKYLDRLNYHKNKVLYYKRRQDRINNYELV